jgi:succinate dehydrogenase/fumarate reductase flavoprotein subunit
VLRPRETDVLVIGGGGGGCVAALTATRAGARVLLATKLRLGDGNTVMAEGGIQAAVGAEDSLQRHYDDTLRAGHCAAVRELVAAMVGDGPDAIRWLIREGMDFDLEPGEDRFGGQLLRKRVGGATAARLLSHRDFTGLELMRVVREAVLLAAGISVVERAPAVELLSDARGACAGAVLFDLECQRLTVVRRRDDPSDRWRGAAASRRFSNLQPLWRDRGWARAGLPAWRSAARDGQLPVPSRGYGLARVPCRYAHQRGGARRWRHLAERPRRALR